MSTDWLWAVAPYVAHAVSACFLLLAFQVLNAKIKDAERARAEAEKERAEAWQLRQRLIAHSRTLLSWQHQAEIEGVVQPPKGLTVQVSNRETGETLHVPIESVPPALRPRIQFGRE